MRKSTLELFVGLFMLMGLAALLFLAFQVSGITHYATNNGYLITATFQNIGSLNERAPVSLAGVKIGEVTNILLDNQTLEATVTMKISSQYNKIPGEGVGASIYTAGLLGANYISITPGYGNKFLKGGDKIVDTQPALVLEQMIGQLLYKIKDDSSKKTATEQ